MINPGRRTLAVSLLTSLTLCIAAGCYSQTIGLSFDPKQLPETKGTVKQYTLTPRGDVDGLILNDGTEVKLPPHLTPQVVFSIRPGDAVTIHGLKARALPLVEAFTLTNDATGNIIVDTGPPDGPGRSEETVSAKIAQPLHGPRGDINGALLEDGTVIRLPPPEAERLQASLQAGQTIAARGNVLASPLGKVIDVFAFGPSPDQLATLSARPPRPPAGGPRPGGPGFGPPPPPPPPRG